MSNANLNHSFGQSAGAARFILQYNVAAKETNWPPTTIFATCLDILAIFQNDWQQHLIVHLCQLKYCPSLESLSLRQYKLTLLYITWIYLLLGNIFSVVSSQLDGSIHCVGFHKFHNCKLFDSVLGEKMK